MHRQLDNMSETGHSGDVEFITQHLDSPIKLLDHFLLVTRIISSGAVNALDVHPGLCERGE